MMNGNGWEDMIVKYSDVLLLYIRMWLSDPPTRQILTVRKPTEQNYFSIIGLIENTYE
jgi:hypothetical protein